MEEINPQQFAIDHNRGCLPSNDPIKQLPPQYSAWEELAAKLPKLLLTGNINSFIEKLPQLDIAAIVDDPELLNRAMLVLSYLGHAYVWGGQKPVGHICPNIAVPWSEVANILARPPILSYASYALYNWQRIDCNRDVELDNIMLLNNFLGGQDEDWFVLIHIAIEAKAAPLLYALPQLQRAVFNNDKKLLISSFTTIADSFAEINRILAKMPERCDPFIYYNRVRPFIYGWLNNPAIPNGVIYQGVTKWHNKPQQFRGESGAQSAILPAIDATFNIKFAANDMLHEHLLAMREYMPAPHRKFVEKLEKNAKKIQIAEFIKQQSNNQELIKVYNACIEHNAKFRSIHLEFAKSYINQQAEIASNPTNVGTGGTPFIDYLSEHCRYVATRRL